MTTSSRKATSWDGWILSSVFHYQEYAAIMETKSGPCGARVSPGLPLCGHGIVWCTRSSPAVFAFFLTRTCKPHGGVDMWAVIANMAIPLLSDRPGISPQVSQLQEDAFNSSTFLTHTLLQKLQRNLSSCQEPVNANPSCHLHFSCIALCYSFTRFRLIDPLP